MMLTRLCIDWVIVRHMFLDCLVVVVVRGGGLFKGLEGKKI